jgi:release factor glutamine methyltransferase
MKDTSDMAAAAAPDLPPVARLFEPSDYTAALIQALREAAPRARGVQALEIGFGSGVVLAALAALGAARLTGVDVEPAAIEAGRALLGQAAFADRVELLAGDMFAPVRGRRFDLVVANLPQFPHRPDVPGAFAGRLPHWSDGGPDGRRYLDRFLAELPAYLAPGGSAFLTHNGFLGLERSRILAAQQGLGLRIARTDLVVLATHKQDRMDPTLRAATDGASLLAFGPYMFAELHIVEIAGHLPRT